MNLKEILKKYESGNKKSEDKQVPFFTLKKDGESATVRFLVKDVDDLGKYVFETHKVKIGDYDNFVKCTGNDCVCCRETRTSLRMFVPVFNLKTNQVGGTGLSHNLETDKKLVETLVRHCRHLKRECREDIEKAQAIIDIMDEIIDGCDAIRK